MDRIARRRHRRRPESYMMRRRPLSPATARQLDGMIPTRPGRRITLATTRTDLGPCVDLIAVERVVNGTHPPDTLTRAEKHAAVRVLTAHGVGRDEVAARVGLAPATVTKVRAVMAR